MSEMAVNVGPHGFISLVGVHGDDEMVVNSARVSYTGGRRKSSSAALIRTMIREGHWGPFDHPQMTVHVKAPIFVIRQWMRHTSQRFSEISGRYVPLPEENFAPVQWLTKSTTNIQGSSENQIEDPESATQLLNGLYDHAGRAYSELTDLGVSNEYARLVVPVGKYSEIWATASLRSWLHFLQQRMDPHAQAEIREYAGILFGVLEAYFPLTVRSWEEEYMESVRFTRREMEMLRRLLEGEEPGGSEEQSKRFFRKLGLDG